MRTGAPANQRWTLLTAHFLGAAAVAAAAPWTPDVVQLLGKTPAELARFLDERAARAQRVHEHIQQHAAGDTLLLANTPAYDRRVIEAEQRQEPVQQTVLADAFRVLSHRVARAKKGQHAQLGVAEAAEEAELPVGAARLLHGR